MIKELDFFELYDQFIRESEKGKRLQKDGSCVKLSTIDNYRFVRKRLHQFSTEKQFTIRIRPAIRMTKRDLKTEKNYWKKFYHSYTDYLYSLGFFDNYVGLHMKVIRVFFGYLNRDKGIITGDFYKNFYVRKEEISIVTLSPEQLQFLINDKRFEDSLPDYLRKTKDIFVFGCTVGLRFSDLMNLRKTNLEQANGSWYLKVRSQKTKTDTRIKLPEYAVEILKKYKWTSKTILPALSVGRLNLTVKQLCEMAGWTHEVGKVREKRGLTKAITHNGSGTQYRFCDLVTTHTMRRTAITVLLSLGVPETMVRKISGHSPNSKEFYRYVEYAQHYLDKETDRVFSSLKLPEKHAEMSVI